MIRIPYYNEDAREEKSMNGKHRVMIGLGWMIFAYAYKFRDMNTAAAACALIGALWNYIGMDTKKLRLHIEGLTVLVILPVIGYLLCGDVTAMILGILNALASFLLFSYGDPENTEVSDFVYLITKILFGIFVITMAGYLVTGMGIVQFAKDFAPDFAGLFLPVVWVLLGLWKKEKIFQAGGSAVTR